MRVSSSLLSKSFVYSLVLMGLLVFPRDAQALSIQNVSFLSAFPSIIQAPYTGNDTIRVLGFKFSHLAGAGAMFTTGQLTSVVFLPDASIEGFETTEDLKDRYFSGYLLTAL